MILSCTAARDAKLQWILRRELRISDGLVRRLKPKNAFAVNGEIAHTNRIVHVGDVVTATIEEEAPDFPAEVGPLSIVYEDEAIIVLDKPAGLIVHPTSNREGGTLANYLLGYYQASSQASAVHVLTRLDRDTMGLVLYAKNAYVHALLMEAQAAGEMEKTYLAKTRGWLDTDEGTIDLPIARLAPGSLLRCVREDGKRAVTRYRVLERGASSEELGMRSEEFHVNNSSFLPPHSSLAEAACLLELQPLTGRTHQLRVHCAAVDHPILGDPQYGGGEGGQRLVCKRLCLSHPLTGKPLSFISKQNP